jgi:hypothetical protein
MQVFGSKGWAEVGDVEHLTTWQMKVCFLDPANITVKQKPRLMTTDDTSTERAELEHSARAIKTDQRRSSSASCSTTATRRRCSSTSPAARCSRSRPSPSGCRAGARLEAAGRLLLPGRTKRLQVGGRRSQNVRVVVELSKARVALAAKKAANQFGHMAMIDHELTIRLLADRTDAALLLHQLAVIVRRKAVSARVQFFPVLGVGAPSVAPARVDLIKVSHAGRAIPGKHTLSIVRVLCISLSSRCIPAGIMEHAIAREQSLPKCGVLRISLPSRRIPAGS